MAIFMVRGMISFLLSCFCHIPLLLCDDRFMATLIKFIFIPVSCPLSPSAKEKLIDYIMNLTPEQVEKIIAKLDELKQLVSISEERTEKA